MNEMKVPDGWELKKLSDLMLIHSGHAFKSKDYVKEGIFILRTVNIDLDGKTNRKNSVFLDNSMFDEYSKYELKENDVLMVMVGATIGKIGIISKNNLPALLNQNMWLFRPQKIEAKFLFYLLKNIIVKYFPNLQGSGMKFFHIGDFRNMEQYIPSQSIQKKIVKKLDYVIEQLEEKKQQIFLLIEHNKERINFFEKNWNKFLISSMLTKNNTMNDWIETTFEDVCKRITYGFTNPMPHVKEGPWLITAKNIKNSIVNYDNALKTDWKSFNELISDKSRPKIGTVVIIKDGATIGRVGIIDRENTCISQSVGSLDPITSKILPEFLLLILESPEIQSKIFEKVKRNTIEHIQITVLAKWTFNLPPIEIQRKILQDVKNIEKKFKIQLIQFKKIQESFDERIKYINHIQSSILDSAFSGKLVN